MASASASPAAGGAIASAAMVFVKPESAALKETLTARLNPEARPAEFEACDVRIPDFDGVHFRVEATEAAPNTLRVSMFSPAWKDLEACGAEAQLKAVYGSWVVPSTDGSSVTLSLSLDKDATAGNWEKTVQSVSLLRRHAMAAPFAKALNAVLGGSGASCPPILVRFRPREPILILPRAERVIVVYALHFQDTTDRAIARIVAQEFVESTRTIANAPPCTFTDRDREPPAEIRGQPDVPAPGSCPESLVGYLSFGVFPRHFDTEAKREAAITQLVHFHTYLDYHIKAAKSYLHTRMRSNVDGWMLVLNRAQPEDPFAAKEKKLASGKTFVRK